MKNALVLAGASAVGKTTVATALIEQTGGAFEIVRSLTTRKRRGDGFDGEYLYTDRDGFLSELSLGRILEHTEYAGELYGTPLSEIERIRAAGKTPLLILDLVGVSAVSRRTDALSPCTVYLYCDLATVDSRLRKRYLRDETDTAARARYESRLAQNLRDFTSLPSRAQDFYAFLKNTDDPPSTAAKLHRVFKSFCKGRERDRLANIAVAEELRASVSRRQ